MNKTKWKPLEEIEFLLKGREKIAVISCGTCANLSGTGGIGGMREFERALKKWRKKTTLARCVVACCPEAIMEQTMVAYSREIGASDAMVILSCAAGVKAANLCRPPVPVISVLDPAGSVAVTDKDGPLAESECKVCGQCVISLTGGICPIGACPAKSKYGPCRRAEEGDGACALDPGRPCIWKIIGAEADLAGLAELKKLHEKNLERPSPVKVPAAPSVLGWTSTWLAARLEWLEMVIRSIK